MRLYSWWSLTIFSSATWHCVFARSPRTEGWFCTPVCLREAENWLLSNGGLDLIARRLSPCICLYVASFIFGPLCVSKLCIIVQLTLTCYNLAFFVVICYSRYWRVSDLAQRRPYPRLLLSVRLPVLKRNCYPDICCFRCWSKSCQFDLKKNQKVLHCRFPVEKRMFYAMTTSCSVPSTIICSAEYPWINGWARGRT